VHVLLLVSAAPSRWLHNSDIHTKRIKLDVIHKRGDLRENDHLGDPGVDWRIILRWIFNKWDGGMDWIELAQGRDRWRALMKAVMNLRVP
jgi:hypothetical protein